MLLVRSMHPRWLSNAYLVGGRPGGTALFVDSGAPLEPLFAAIDEHRLRPVALLTTHRHFDHVEGHAGIGRRFGAEILALEGEAEHVGGATATRPEEERDFGGLHVRAVPLPGHTSGHAGWFIRGIGLFTGDCFFAGSVGGTVGEGSSGFADARRALARILAFPDDTVVHPGHAGPTTVGAERERNPFLRVLDGRDPEGDRPCEALGRAGRLIVLARDYDGGTKGWVRFSDDDTDAFVPGSRIQLK